MDGESLRHFYSPVKYSTLVVGWVCDHGVQVKWIDFVIFIAGRKGKEQADSWVSFAFSLGLL